MSVPAAPVQRNGRQRQRSATAAALPAVAFLRCRTPSAWIDAALGSLELLLQDHATLELKAAEQAQRLIRRYGAARTGGTASFRATLIAKLSRLAREELRHFEQVVDILTVRGSDYRPVPASRYAAGLHAIVRREEPGRLVDTLLVGAVIEARSCERFASLAPALEAVDAGLAGFYASLLRAEARHYQDYLRLAQQAAASRASEAAADGRVAAGTGCSADSDGPAGAALVADRLDQLLTRDEELVRSDDVELRFHSGVPPLF